jgi:glutathione peroxidase
MKSIYDIKVKNIKNEEVLMQEYKGKVLLIVNVASKCGFTPQYKELEEIYREYKDKGLEILAFPCNQFGNQEPGSNEEIYNFCSTKYNVTFPLFSKIDVNGSNAHELYIYLKEKAPGILGTEAIKWNFTKFLVDRDGNVIKRYAPQDNPKKIIEDIKKYL